MCEKTAHTCVHTSHAYSHKQIWEGGRERERSSGFGFDDFGSLRMILKVQAIEVSDWCLTGMGWGSEWRADFCAGCQRSQHPTSRQFCKINSEYGLESYSPKMSLPVFRKAHGHRQWAGTEDRHPSVTPPTRYTLRSLGNPKEGGQPTEEWDQIYTNWMLVYPQQIMIT